MGIKMKINYQVYSKTGTSNVNNFSSDSIKTPHGSRLDPVQTEVEQAKNSKIATEIDINLKNDYSQANVKQAMDHPLLQSLYLLPPFI
jgi:hypothetical protein